MYYGNSDPALTDQQDTINVWDPNYKMVQHLEDTSAAAITDSTVYANNGIAYNGATLGVTGKADGAISFNPSTPPDYINCGNSASLDVTGKITVEAWVYPTAANLNKGIVAKTQAGPQYRLYIANTTGRVCFEVWDAINANWLTATATAPNGGVLTQNTWHQIVGVCDDTNIIIYVDGVGTTGSLYGGSIDSTTSPVTIGIHAGLVTGNAFQGTIDEARISDTDRSLDWIETSYVNQANPTVFSTTSPAPENFTTLYSVGGKVFTINKAVLVAPWFAAAIAICLFIAVFILHIRRRYYVSPGNGLPAKHFKLLAGDKTAFTKNKH
jgi:hypothetical protein